MDQNGRLRRRSLVAAGSAWAVPTVVMATAAPAFAVSKTCNPACPAPTALTFGNNKGDNDWTANNPRANDFPDNEFVTFGNTRTTDLPTFKATYTPTNNTSPCTGASGDSGGSTLDNAMAVDADVRVWFGVAPTATYRRTICLSNSKTYTFDSNWSSYNVNRRTLTLEARILRSDTGEVAARQAGGAVVAASGTSNSHGSKQIVCKPASSTDYIFEYLWTHSENPSSANADCDRYANDIGVTAPILSC